MTTTDETIAVWINPLLCVATDAPLVEPGAEDGSPSAMLDFLVPPGVDGSPEAMVCRAKEIHANAAPIVAVPLEQDLMARIVWPLRQARGAYTTGNYVATVALCGMVAEMVAIVFFEMGVPKVNGVPMDHTRQAGIFGSSFEKLGQDKRVGVLFAFGLIDVDTKSHFDSIRAVRKRYLHLFSTDLTSLPRDARDAYAAATQLLHTLMGMQYADGKLVLPPRFRAWLEARRRPGE